jgi:hypothetical protein
VCANPCGHSFAQGYEHGTVATRTRGAAGASPHHSVSPCRMRALSRLLRRTLADAVPVAAVIRALCLVLVLVVVVSSPAAAAVAAAYCGGLLPGADVAWGRLLQVAAVKSLRHLVCACVHVNVCV